MVIRTYPKQIGINPLPMDWGNLDPAKRGPIVVSRASSTIRRRNGSFVRPRLLRMCELVLLTFVTRVQLLEVCSVPFPR